MPAKFKDYYRVLGVTAKVMEGDILITLYEVLNGAMDVISVRRTNARTRWEETATYQVRIPAGVQAGQ